jgi:hypothetical protein
LQLGDAVFRAAPRRRFCELCQTRPLPAARRPFRAPPFQAGPFGGVDPPEPRAASWLYSSNRNPLGNCISSGPETGPGPDSARTRFLRSRLAAQLLCRKTGSAATPSRGTGDICLPAARAAQGRAAPVAAHLSPVARDYPSRALSGFFMPPHCAAFHRNLIRSSLWPYSSPYTLRLSTDGH